MIRLVEENEERRKVIECMLEGSDVKMEQTLHKISNGRSRAHGIGPKTSRGDGMWIQGGQLKQGEKEEEQRGIKPQDRIKARKCVSEKKNRQKRCERSARMS